MGQIAFELTGVREWLEHSKIIIDCLRNGFCRRKPNIVDPQDSFKLLSVTKKVSELISKLRKSFDL